MVDYYFKKAIDLEKGEMRDKLKNKIHQVPKKSNTIVFNDKLDCEIVKECLWELLPKDSITKTWEITCKNSYNPYDFYYPFETSVSYKVVHK